MAKSDKIDVHNKSKRTYTSMSGIEIGGGKTVSLDRSEAESLMRNYPRELVSLDSMRSEPSAQSNKDQHDEIVKLQKKVNELESGAVTDPKGIKRIAELEDALKTALATNAELAQRYDESVKSAADFAMQVTKLTVKNEDLTKAMEDAKQMATDAYAEIDRIKGEIPPDEAS